MRREAAVATFLAVGTAAACTLVVAPEEPSIQAIVFTAPASLRDVLAEVNRVHLRVSRPGAPPRDTVLQPLFRRGSVRARAILRPDEGEPRTLVEIDLKRHAAFLFRGSVRMGPESGWPIEVRVPVIPVGTFDAGGDRIVVVGESVELDDGATIVLGDGQERTPAGVAWLTLDSAVVEIASGTAVARSVGQAEVLGVWYGRVDTVAFNVRPEGAIFVSDSAPTYYVDDGDRLADTLDVTQDVVGEVGQLSVGISSGSPWLSASLEASSAPTQLMIGIDGAALPEDSPPGKVVVSSSERGVADVVMTVHARKDPAIADAVRWSRFCVLGERVAPNHAGVNACLDMQVKAWIEGDSTRVVVHVDNLQGSLGDSLDTAPALKVTGWGVFPATVSGPIQLLHTRAIGLVNVRGTPILGQENDGGFSIDPSPSDGALIGCVSSNTDNSYGTCDPTGFTGVLRADFMVADTSWSLAGALPYMDFSIPGVGARNICVADPAGVCTVVR